MPHATPRPWKLLNGKAMKDSNFGNYNKRILGSENSLAAKAYGGILDERETADANAALIVHAVNTFDEAKAAIKAVLHEYDKASMFDANGSKFDELRAVLADMEG